MLTWLAIIAPILGAAIGRQLNTSIFLKRVLDGFCMTFLGVLLILEWVPHGFHESGFIGLGAFIFGYIIAERVHIFEEKAREPSLQMDALWLVGIIILHVFSDGVLLSSMANEAHDLELGLLTHRLLFGISIVGGLSLLRMRAWLWPIVLTATIVTSFGYLCGHQFGHAIHHVTGTLSLFVCGGLIHVVAHLWKTSSRGAGDDFGARSASSFGAAIGILSAIFVLLNHAESGHVGVVGRFWGFLETSATPLLIAYGISGFISTSRLTSASKWLGRGNEFIQSFKGAALGLPLPVCSCGVLPLYQSLVQRGVPLTAGFAFLIATPEIGLEALLMSVPLLGGEMTLIRLMTAALVAMIVPTLLLQICRRIQLSVTIHTEHEHDCCHHKAEEESTTEQPRNSGRQTFIGQLKRGFRDNAIDTLPWVFVGLLIAALCPTETLSSLFERIPTGLDILFAAVVGVPLYICASGATPFVAALMAAGLSPGAGLTMLLLGPATNVTTYGILSRLHGRRVAQLFMVCIFVVVVALSVMVNIFVDLSIEHVAIEHSHHSWLQHGSSLALCALIGWNIYEHGFKKFIQALNMEAHA